VSGLHTVVHLHGARYGVDLESRSFVRRSRNKDKEFGPWEIERAATPEEMAWAHCYLSDDDTAPTTRTAAKEGA
jgi:hypothetical protein